ncbi:sensor histidine kinase [Microbacterium pseudoresistens]|uniref:histidine kinase n=1 Tax=Microbacterium pseudoresistens TaxID=640634 RepID=A0A7Y9JMG1_9MICO|nr:histidine kinase [Microbacterium pseudoresistens]NYD53498.1 signal transduction histidine kinase [Microbacterium pseudoresistens]
MFRSVPRVWLAFDIVGAVLGLIVTAPMGLSLVVGEPSPWIGGGLALVIHVVLAVVMWSAAAIARLSPSLALIIAWIAAVAQMACGYLPAPFDIAVFAVVFATAAWGSRHVLWLGGASAVGGGLIAGVYVALLQRDQLIQDAGTVWRTLTFGGLIAAVCVLSLVLAWGAGVLWRLIARGRLTREAQVRAEALAAAEQERVRIARDMHDVVAHSLAVVIAQADGARYAAAADPDQATRALTTIAQTSRAALSDVRMLLTQLRHSQGDGPQPTLADLEELYAQMRAAGLDPRVTVDPTPPGEPPAAIQLAVYRILQEALTNALRHGAGGAEVRLSWWPDRVELIVDNLVRVAAADRAAEATGARTTGGHGIVGMRERAQLVGGTLAAERMGERFVVRAALPIGGAA